MKLDSRTCLLLVGLLSGSAYAAAPVLEVGDGSRVDQDTSSVVLSDSTQTQSPVKRSLLFTMQQQMDQMQEQINTLRGQLEEQQYRYEQMLKRQRELYQTMGKLQGFAGNSANTEQKVDDKQPDSAPLVAGSQSESQDYDHAITLVLRDKKYTQAIGAFRDFIKRYPKSSYLPNVHYWLGQLLFSQSQYDDANREFKLLADQYKTSSKRPEALLKLGVIAQMQGQKDQAKQYYNQLIKSYPNNSSTLLAKERIGQLKDVKSQG